MIPMLEKVFLLKDDQLLKWGAFNAFMNLFLGVIILFSPVYLMTVVQNRVNEIANIRKVDAQILSDIELFDSQDEFLTIAYHLSKDAALLEKLPEIFSLLLFLSGLTLIISGVQQLKLRSLIKEKEEK